MESDNRRGMLFGFMAYFLWGIFPIYFKLLHSVPAVQILGNRITWSFLLLSGVLLVRREWGAFRRSINSARLVALYLTAGLLLAVNWLIYIWGVNAGYIVETSLGYFINPLVNVLLGVIFLKERLRPAQWAPIALAAAGVTYLTINYGHLPWIAISLAVTFGLYGLAKKKSPLGSVFGLTLETGVLVLPAVAALLFWEVQGVGQLGHRGLAGDLLLAASGIITVIPLLLFGSAARSIPLSTLGLLQYIAPTLQFLIGVLVYREPFSGNQLIGFGLIWLALAVFWIEGMRHRRQAAGGGLSAAA